MITDVPVVVGPGFGVRGPVGAPVGGGFGAGGGFPSITGLPAVGVSPAALPDVGFQVAGGDSVGLDAASITFTDIEDQLRGHATTIQTAPQCAPTWTGEAAHAYANLSDLVAAHFQNAANTAADARDALQRWSTELHRCQREGMTAVTEAQHWLAEIKTQQLALTTAQTDTATTQIALAAAQANLALAHALGPAPAATTTTARLQADATAAQNALTTAQTAATTARTKLDDAYHQLAVWQARGRQAWQDAEHAAQTATHTLTPLLLTPPPLAGLPTPLTPNPPFTGPADPNCQNQTGRTTNTNTGGLPTQLRNLAASIFLASPGTALVLRALADAIENGTADDTVGGVISETATGSGNVTSAYTLTRSQAIDAGERWLGEDYSELGKPGSGVYRSADGTRQFRIDPGSLDGNHPPGLSHVHLEGLAPGAARPYVNNHIPFGP